MQMADKTTILAERLTLARTRIKPRLTQVKMAERLGATAHTTIWRWENGRTTPGDRDIIAVAQVLGTTPEWLKGETEEEDSEVLKVVGPGPQDVLALAGRLNAANLESLRSVVERLLENQPDTDVLQRVAEGRERYRARST